MFITDFFFFFFFFSNRLFANCDITVELCYIYMSVFLATINIHTFAAIRDNTFNTALRSIDQAA